MDCFIITVWYSGYLKSPRKTTWGDPFMFHGIVVIFTPKEKMHIAAHPSYWLPHPHTTATEFTPLIIPRLPYLAGYKALK